MCVSEGGVDELSPNQVGCFPSAGCTMGAIRKWLVVALLIILGACQSASQPQVR